MISRINSLIFGLTLPFQAGTLILRRPALLGWSILPIAVTLGLYTWIIHALNVALQTWMQAHFLAWHWNPSGWGAVIFSGFLHILLILVAAISFSFVASIAASPFNDFLAEAAEKWGSPPLAPVQDRTILIKARLIMIDAGKSLAATIAGLAALLLAWVPLVNAVTFLLTFLLISFQYISYPQTRRSQGLGDGVRFLWDHPFACAGFGATMALLFSIPIVSSLSLPLAVVGGTLLVARAQAPGLK